MKNRLIILHNIRSSHNVGAILRSAACFGTFEVVCTGFTPYPSQMDDGRLPHIKDRAERQIHKTALGAEELLTITHHGNIAELIDDLKQQGYAVAAIEQAAKSTPLEKWQPSTKQAIILGNEPKGIDRETLGLVDEIVEIPMTGPKESLNVAVAGAIVFHYVSLFDLSTGSFG